MILPELLPPMIKTGAAAPWSVPLPLSLTRRPNSGKIVGENPNFDNLTNGDLTHQFDFRSLYATILKQKLGVDPSKAGISQDILRGVFS